MRFDKQFPFLCIILFFISFARLFAQPSVSTTQINLHTGKVVKNWSSEGFPERNVAKIFTVNFGKQHLGMQEWHNKWQFPQTGVIFALGYLGNSSQLGYTMGCVPYITFGSTYKKNIRLEYTFGLGLTYFNKPFDKENNPNNILIGSSITNLSVGMIQMAKRINQKNDILFGISAFHASNAHFQVPNVGLNLPAITVGYRYYAQTLENLPIQQKNRNGLGKLTFNILQGIGVHEFAGTIEPVGTPKFLVYSTTLTVAKTYNNIFRFHAGLNTRYYNSYLHCIEENNLYAKNQKLKAIVITPVLSCDAMFGKISFNAQGGLNVYNPFYKKWQRIQNKREDIFLYARTYLSSRLGLQYAVLTDDNNSPKLWIGAYAKANFSSADFAEMGIGWKIY